MSDECRSCHKPIVWAVTVANQKRMPVDPTPILGGNVVLTAGPEARVLGKNEAEARAARGIRAHVSHFTTCPAADAHRR